GGRQGLAVSTDNGINWTIRTIPNTATGESDPSIGVASDGTVYFGFVDGDGHPKIAVSHDKGATWDTWNSPRGAATFIDVGEPFGLQNAVFAAVVAGDPDRAAFTFHGSPTAGPFQDASFNGVWDLFVAHTYDGGRTWTTVKATNDPTQRGCIWLGGGSNPCRNLLDFMDATIDAQGRVLVGFADGCTGACATDPANTAKSVWATIARQSAGLGVFSAFDPKPFTEQNVNSLVTLQASSPTSGSGISSFNLSIKDISTQTIHVPLRAEVAQLTSSSGKVTVRNADNSLSGIGSLWDYSASVGADNLFSAGETSAARILKFNNPNNEAFTVTFNIIGGMPYSGPSCCSPGGASSAGSSGGTSGSSTASSSNSIGNPTKLVYQLTYNPLLNSFTVQLISPQ
ncbi:MAG: sialidase family protein, partial [Acidobacteriota bacterium]